MSTSDCKCNELRDLADRCEQLADEVDAGRGTPEVLVSEIARLRTVFDAHRRNRRHSSTGQAESALAIPTGLARELGPTGELRVVLSALRSYLAVETRCTVRLTLRVAK